MAWADLTDCRCYYELLGAGPPLLLIPGLGSTCRVWDPVAARLAQDFSVISADGRGVGQSVAKRYAHSLRDYSADLIELLDHLQVDQPHIMGLSLGGMIAQRLAVDHPSRASRLVLLSTAHRFSPYLREMAKLVGETMRRFPRPLFEKTMALLSGGPPYLDANPHWNNQPLQSLVPIRALVRQLRCLAAADHQPDRCDIRSQTLVIAGEYDALIPSCYARELAEAISGARFQLIPDAGHNPLVECPEQLIPLITAFMKAGEFNSAHLPRAGPIPDAA